MNAAIYLRVSSDRQDMANQELQVRALCAARGFTIEPQHEYRVTERGDARDNPVKEACVEAARLGYFRAIVIWSLDRWTRDGIAVLLTEVARLKRWGVALVSVQEPWCDTSQDGPGELMLAIAGWMGKQEKKRLQERNRATAERLRAELKVRGKLVSSRSGRIFESLGRPRIRVSPEAIALASKLRAMPAARRVSDPMGWPAIAARVTAELGETYKATTLSRAVTSKISTPSEGPSPAQTAA